MFFKKKRLKNRQDEVITKISLIDKSLALKINNSFEQRDYDIYLLQYDKHKFCVQHKPSALRLHIDPMKYSDMDFVEGSFNLWVSTDKYNTDINIGRNIPISLFDYGKTWLFEEDRKIL